MTHYFPQLKDGVTAQFPVKKTLSFRTVVNAQDMTSALRASDQGAERIAWLLKLRALDDAEIAAIENTFRNTRGPLDSLVFLDPEGNLVKHSEDLSRSSWVKSAGAGITVAPSVPALAAAASRMSAPAGQAGEVHQPLDLPCGYRWMLSLYARADSATQITLFVRSANGEAAEQYPLDTAWKRISFGGVFWQNGTGIEVGVRLSAGNVADLSAFQLESQMAPSEYKRTEERNGVYEDARFGQESLRVTTLAPNCHQVNLTITAPLAGQPS